MLDYVMLQYQTGSALRGSVSRCAICGQSSVVASDGFLMMHCFNCGAYHSSAAPIGLSFGQIKDGVMRLFSKLEGLWSIFILRFKSPSQAEPQIRGEAV